MRLSMIQTVFLWSIEIAGDAHFSGFLSRAFDYSFHRIVRVRRKTRPCTM